MKRVVQIAYLIIAMPTFSQAAACKFDVMSVKSDPVGRGPNGLFPWMR